MLSTEPGWRAALASVTGSSHEVSGLPCQDSSACAQRKDAAGAPVLVATVSDGAGSAAFAAEGARCATARAMEWASGLVASEAFHGGGALDSPSAFLIGLRDELSQRASARSVPTREFACTLLLAAIGAQRAVFLQIGDGAIVVRDRDPADWNWVFWPQHGEFANSTRFVTDADAENTALWEDREAAVLDLALFSDGLERLLLHFGSRKVHRPFFERMFPPLWSASVEKSNETPVSTPLSVSLAQYLRSDVVRRNADDDLSLILATVR